VIFFLFYIFIALIFVSETSSRKKYFIGEKQMRGSSPLLPASRAWWLEYIPPHGETAVIFIAVCAVLFFVAHVSGAAFGNCAVLSVLLWGHTCSEVAVHFFKLIIFAFVHTELVHFFLNALATAILLPWLQRLVTAAGSRRPVFDTSRTVMALAALTQLAAAAVNSLVVLLPLLTGVLRTFFYVRHRRLVRRAVCSRRERLAFCCRRCCGRF
jgi:hypothetical protein